MTTKGCFTYDKEDTTYVTLKPCLPSEEANQAARWDKTDIVFDHVVDAKLGKYLKVSDELNYLQLTGAKRRTRFRQVPVIAQSTMRSECFLKVGRVSRAGFPDRFRLFTIYR